MDAFTLRILLLILGIGFLIALFFWELRRAARVPGHGRGTTAPPGKHKREPNLGIGHGEEHAPSARVGAQQQLRSKPLSEADLRDLNGILTNTHAGLLAQVFLVARNGFMSGAAILAAANRHRMFPGRKEIFHRIDEERDPPRTLFSMANLVQPGSFPLKPNPCEAMNAFTTRGIALFTIVRGEPDDIEALDAMLAATKSLARELSAEIEDGQRQPITVKRIELLRQCIINHRTDKHDTQITR